MPGERGRRRGHLPSAGASIPHYLGLLLFNRSVVRERFWAAFMYSAVASDLEAGASTGRKDLAGVMLDAFLALGLRDRVADPPPSRAVRWALYPDEIADVDPELAVLGRALTGPGADGLGDAGHGMPPAFFATSTEGARYQQFLCPGSIILMRRSLMLLLGEQEVVGHAALSELIETALVDHAALYYVRTMRVVNDLSSGRALPEDCQALLGTLRARPETRRHAGEARAVGPRRLPRGGGTGRWRLGRRRRAKRTTTCSSMPAGRNSRPPRSWRRSTIERLRRQLAEYTVNRIS